jgi:hypothetical protein
MPSGCEQQSTCSKYQQRIDVEGRQARRAIARERPGEAGYKDLVRRPSGQDLSADVPKSWSL